MIKEKSIKNKSRDKVILSKLSNKINNNVKIENIKFPKKQSYKLNEAEWKPINKNKKMQLTYFFDENSFLCKEANTYTTIVLKIESILKIINMLFLLRGASDIIVIMVKIMGIKMYKY